MISNQVWGVQETEVLAGTFKNGNFILKGLSGLTKNTSGATRIQLPSLQKTKMSHPQRSQYGITTAAKNFITSMYTNRSAIYTSCHLLFFKGRAVAVPNPISCFTACIKQHYCSISKY